MTEERKEPTNEQLHAIRQMYIFCLSEEGKSHEGYYGSGWAGLQVRDFLIANKADANQL